MGRTNLGGRKVRVAGVLLVLVLVISVTVGATRIERTSPETPTEGEYRSIVIFRNDDVQPAYRPETMRAVDRIFVEQEVPITQGVIPIAHGRPITETNLCPYLRAQARKHPDTFEFALHGYSHAERTGFGGRSEFGGLPAETQREYVREGARILTECTGETPRTFVPPFNTYDDATVAALAAQNFTAISSIERDANDPLDRSDHARRNGVRPVPAAHGFVNWSSGELYAPSDLRESFDRSHANGSVHVQMIHYATFDTEAERDRLRSFIRYVKSHDVAFLTVGEFTEARAEGRLERTDDGWRYRPESESPRSGPTRTVCSVIGSDRCAAVGLATAPDPIAFAPLGARSRTALVGAKR